MGKLIYGTQTGTTDEIAEKIQKALPDLIDEVKPVFRASPEDFQGSDFFILGGSTWGDGELTDDWQDFYPQLDQIDFTGKTVALFGLGDQYGYGYNFVSAMKILYDKVKEKGARVIACEVSTEGFDYEHSESVEDNQFIGLVLDEVNQPEMTEERIESWCEQVKTEAPAAVSQS